MWCIALSAASLDLNFPIIFIPGVISVTIGFLGVLVFLVAAGAYLKYRKYRAQERARAELRREMSWQN